MSTDAKSLTKAAPTRADEAVPAWQLFALAGLLGATFVVFMSRGQTPAAILLLSLTIFAAAGVGIGALRTLTPLAEDVDDYGPVGRVVGGRARIALEREKALTLRAIKELEFDRAMGKMSESDFADMSTRLRAKAAGLIRRLDDGASYRSQIDGEVERRLRESGAPAPSVATTTATCANCHTPNDADARFCKQCGGSLGRA